MFLESIPALLMPVIILGGIYGGIFTPSEAGCIAAVYGFIAGFFIYKELKFSMVPGICVGDNCEYFHDYGNYRRSRRFRQLDDEISGYSHGL